MGNTQLRCRGTGVHCRVGIACHLALIGKEEEVNCFRPMRLYINMQRLSDRLDVCLITVLVVVRVWLSERVVTRSDRLGAAERVGLVATA